MKNYCKCGEDGVRSKTLDIFPAVHSIYCKCASGSSRVSHEEAHRNYEIALENFNAKKAVEEAHNTSTQGSSK